MLIWLHLLTRSYKMVFLSDILEADACLHHLILEFALKVILLLILMCKFNTIDLYLVDIFNTLFRFWLVLVVIIHLIVFVLHRLIDWITKHIFNIYVDTVLEFLVQFWQGWLVDGCERLAWGICWENLLLQWKLFFFCHSISGNHKVKSFELRFSWFLLEEVLVLHFVIRALHYNW